jgi:hypothetical protein
MLSSPNACLIIVRVSVAHFPICTQFVAVHLSDPSWNPIRPDTWVKINGHKKSALPPGCVKFCILIC